MAAGVVMEATFQTGCWARSLRCCSGPRPSPPDSLLTFRMGALLRLALAGSMWVSCPAQQY